MAELDTDFAARFAALSEQERAALLAQLPAPPAESPPSTAFKLGDGAAPLPAKLRDFYKKRLVDYEEIYGRGERAIKRWVSVGRHATPPEPPPLDEPPRMAAWWRRHMDMNPPRELLEYERGAPPIPPAETAAHGTSGGRATGEQGAPPASSSPSTPPAAVDPLNRLAVAVNLSELGLGEGELVQQMRAIVKGNYAQVDAALKAQDQGTYQRWFPIYAESAEALRKLEKEYREAAKSSGSMLPKAKIIAELSQMLEALRLMREAMPQKIIAELEKRAEGRKRKVLQLIAPALVEAIQAVRQREGDVLANVESLSSPSSAREAFTLQAA